MFIKEKFARNIIFLLAAILLPIFCKADPNFTETEIVIGIYVLNVIPALLYMSNMIVFLCLMFKVIVHKLLFYLIIILNIIMAMVVLWPQAMFNKKETFFWFGYFPVALAISSIIRRNYLVKASSTKKQ
jgi:hypothetical protein